MIHHGRMVAMASVVSVASIGAVFGFAIVPPNNRALERRGPLSISVPLRKRNRSASASSSSSSSITVAPWSSFPSALMYADSGSSNDDARDWTVDEATLSPPTTTKNKKMKKSSLPIVVKPEDDIQYRNAQKEEEHEHEHEQKQDDHDRDEETHSETETPNEPLPTDISAAIQEILTAPVVVPMDETKDEAKQEPHLILPVSATRSVRTNPNPGTRNGSNLNVDPNANLESASSGDEPPFHLHSGAFVGAFLTRWKNTAIDPRSLWKKLRPGQKFRLRLGVATLAFVSLYNAVLAGGAGATGGWIGTRVVSGAAATATATTTATTASTGFGSLLRRWLSSRGFQGISAFGRSVAYGWAILVAYPRMLDRRAKERRAKKEEEALRQWRQVLKGIAEEVVRLKKELSLLEGEIRAFRREILAIRAARVGNNGNSNRNHHHHHHHGRSNSNNRTSNDAEHAEIHPPHTHINRSSSNDDSSDRLLRDAVIHEMNHLTRLRDDTRLALTRARQRWSEVRAKKPMISGSNASGLDPLEYEYEIDVAAAGSDLDRYRYNDDRDPRGNDDLLLRGL
eukprot:CAMPEP_0172400318 /NCGR_PEP_ID=MMETSP1061-20121228/45345_1 /TAXON_ID=37318 /ORGANISM="Pseudo-nitzschia pungens, Strain cf. pungens" /LENGTH=567 /DNA_ID=CAMNT_0013133531 /DNA_START=201 /DNA_END=1904 /DNA_ORIENTATION=-